MILTEKKMLVYSCSGCSSAAQMANYLALQLDKAGVAEMSCIAGVGGNVKSLVRTAASGRPIVAIDGCALACSKACLQNHQIEPERHLVLSDMGVEKKKHADFDPGQAHALLDLLLEQLRCAEVPVSSQSPVGDCEEK